jgi:hypothetical protein
MIKASMAAVPPIGELDPEALLHKLGYDVLTTSRGARGDLGCLHLRGGLL